MDPKNSDSYTPDFLHHKERLGYSEDLIELNTDTEFAAPDAKAQLAFGEPRKRCQLLAWGELQRSYESKNPVFVAKHHLAYLFWGTGRCQDYIRKHCAEVAVLALAKFPSFGLRAIKKRAAPKRFKPAISRKALL